VLCSGSPAPLRRTTLRMAISFENDKNVIVYAFEQIISYTRQHQYIFVAQSVWWLAPVIGLQEGWTSHIDNLQKREIVAKQEELKLRQERQITSQSEYLPSQVHSDRIIQISNEREISVTPRNLPEDPRACRILDRAERFLAQSR